MKSDGDVRKQLALPVKQELFGVGVSIGLIDAIAHSLIAAAEAGVPLTVEAIATYNLVIGNQDPQFKEVLNSFDVVIADGQPIRFALNWLHDARLEDRVTARDLMTELLARAESRALSVYFYGDEQHTIHSLVSRFTRLYPKLHIAGAEPSVFRPLTTKELDDLSERVNASGAALLFVALGCPLQEWFIHENHSRFKAVQLCVGSAFKYHAGERIVAPRWMQAAGIEWLFRVALEPRRLWRRFFLVNQRFVWMLLLAILRKNARAISTRFRR